jgi:hypothetical protein
MKLKLAFATVIVALTAFFILGQTTNPVGTWAGALTTDAGPGGLEISLKRVGESWKADARIRLEGEDASLPVENLKIIGTEISFSISLGGTTISFAGKFDGDKLIGTLEAFKDGRKLGQGTMSLTRGGVLPPLQRVQGGQMADPDFDAKVSQPAYSKAGPKVLFDEAHNNFHTTIGRYKPFVDLITNDGYQVIANKEKFSAAVLKPYDILIISNALGNQRTGGPEAANPAFTDPEADAVRDWVKAGGALLLIADHAPMGSANQILGQRFGIDMSKMYTVDEENYEKPSDNPGFIVYTRESGRLADHPITNGRNQTERVNKVIAFTGQSLKGPATSEPFMRLADTAMDRMPNDTVKPVSAAGRAQGIAMKFAKGRAVFLGEAAMLTAQVTGTNKFGMNYPGIDNRQLALNIVHWLSRRLK